MLKSLIEKVMERHSLTQEELAKKLRVDRAWIVRAKETKALRVYIKLMEMNR